MLPRSLFKPVPLNVIEVSGVLWPIFDKSIVPDPFEIFKALAPLIDPTVTVPLPFEVKVKSLANEIVRDVPLKSISFVAKMEAGTTTEPVPCNTKLATGVDAPIKPPKLIVPLPVLIVKSWPPLIVLVDPLNVMLASVELKVIAPVDNVIGPV